MPELQPATSGITQPKLLYPGSFDPFTRGHAEVVLTAATLGHVVIGVAHNSTKNALFSVEERCELITATLTEAGLPESAYSVIEIAGLVAHWARQHGISAIVKGVRGVSDLDSEMLQAHVNSSLDAPPTVFVPASSKYQAVSSTVVKEVATYGGDCRWMIAAQVYERLLQRLRERN